MYIYSIIFKKKKKFSNFKKMSYKTKIMAKRDSKTQSKTKEITPTISTPSTPTNMSVTSPVENLEPEKTFVANTMKRKGML
jgi:hypothetical protein